ncbi:4-hydroxythreonine-4-phosphate dehydrogenase [Legionella gratiana]|uniref:4-hydroxythreonine-4-phosphate dehydrogenase n=1 Tax=Legionella gratiana TaxID=45066 RepID=A0A378JFF3_9GAMM|nr:4-hydroxythreonine-4-phosphate dehydrogenase PdxA [Legionella gratiana]KTD13583.1 4-hydroxythreonine-4-phosphate dehydrogenase [Legionella gratiana]STX46179.1 4-hydroxythreonine-4-phosphate dehydrogenase [Legionella gratiana]
MKPLLISSGEPAGIGPDLCLALARYDFPLVILGDRAVLEARAKELKLDVCLTSYQSGQLIEPKPGYLPVLSIPCPDPVQSGCLNPNNAAYVIELLNQAARLCGSGDFSALVTAPVNKANINKAGITFSGHTEFLAQFYNVETVVMMLACQQMKVALVTTHLPLRKVADSITSDLIINVVSQVHQTLIEDFNILNPRIKVAGLNPHAGESGYLGKEEIEVISPALAFLREQGFQVEGPMPADTMFIKNQLNECDAYVAMYHDQGLPVLKYADFHAAVNVTLGLPIIRTSVDHGTALELAGKNLLDTGSMFAAVDMAKSMALSRKRQ